MIPTWLTIELALIPVLLAGISGLIWLVRLEAAVKTNREGLDEAKMRQSKHNDRLYGELRTINKNLHRIMGKLDIDPVD